MKALLSRSLYVAAIVLVLFSSCEKNRIYEKNIAIEKYIWDSKFTPTFTVEIKDTSVLYNLYVNVHHTEIYPFQNIWFMISTKFPDGTKSSRRIQVMLANDPGKWFGEGLGDIWDYRTLIQENAFFTEPGTYIFSLEQNMRQDLLPGIMAVGIRVENTGLHKIGSSSSQIN
ncbi:MAG TPA: gliding motility lipoprotein GldH [Chitinophagales bacterium]|nr:gliding motility lipoprotein GldH [Chitinophagales bacterium]